VLCDATSAGDHKKLFSRVWSDVKMNSLEAIHMIPEDCAFLMTRRVYSSPASGAFTCTG